MTVPAQETFVYPDLRTWQPAAKEVPTHLRAGSLKAALRNQGLSLADHGFRRDLIVRLALGGLGERPYGDKDKSVAFKQRIGHESAQARSRLMSFLFDAEKTDETAPLMDARTSAAIHFMAITYYGDVDWDGYGHKDFREMLEAAFRQGDAKRLDALGRDRHYGEMLDAGHVLLTEAAQKRIIAPPSYVAAKMIRRHDSDTVMHQPSDQAERRIWNWLDLVMWGEPAAGHPDPDAKSNLGRRALGFSLGGDNQKKWYEGLLNLSPHPEWDLHAPSRLRRFMDNTKTSDSQTESDLYGLAHRLDAMRTALAREASAESLPDSLPKGPSRRQKWRT